MPRIALDLGREDVAALFGNASLPPMLRVLAASPGREFSVTQLIEAAGVTSRDGAHRALEAMTDAGWVLERRAGRERLLRVNDDILLSGDPYREVPPAFRDVTRDFVRRLAEDVGAHALWKAYLFGGLALGRGDRLSDIDLLVVSPSPRPVRLAGARLCDNLRTKGFRGERYRVHLLVETPESLRNRRGDPAVPRLLRQAIRLLDAGGPPLEDMLPAPEDS